MKKSSRYLSAAGQRVKRTKIMGMINLANVTEGAGVISVAVLTRCGMTTDEVESMLAEVRGQMKDKSYHAYYPL